MDVPDTRCMHAPRGSDPTWKPTPLGAVRPGDRIRTIDHTTGQPISEGVVSEIITGKDTRYLDEDGNLLATSEYPVVVRRHTPWIDAIVFLAREAVSRTLDDNPVEHYRQPDIPDAVWPEVRQRALQVIETITPDIDDVYDALRAVTQEQEGDQ